VKTLTTEKPRLTGQQAIAIALFSRGLNRHEIADEMMIGYDHLNMVLRRAAAKGYDVPPYLPKRPSSGVSTEDLLAARKKLRDRGITGRAVNAILAKRFGLQTPCVRMRLIRHDRAASASPQPRNLSTEKTVGA